MSGLVSKIKNEVRKVGANKGKFAYVRDGEKRRYRFLTDADDGQEFVFHDDYRGGIPLTACQETFGRYCPLCEQEGVSKKTNYVWSVWDYEDKEVKAFMFPVNRCSPVSQIINFWETYGTLLDRDYVVGVSGRQLDKTYTVAPMDKVKFRNDKAKPFSHNQLVKMIEKAYPYDDGVDDGDDDGEDFPMNKPKAGKKDDDWGDEEKLPAKEDLESMKPVKLYNMCKERDIEVKARKDADYYVEKLEQWREENEPAQEQDDYDAGDDWGDEADEKPDYEKMSAKELYNLCGDRGIEAPTKKPAKFYINLLEEYDKAQDDWGDSEESGTDDEWEEQ